MTKKSMKMIAFLFEWAKRNIVKNKQDKAEYNAACIEFGNFSDQQISDAVNDIVFTTKNWQEKLNLLGCLSQKLTIYGIEKIEIIMTQISIQFFYKNKHEMPVFTKESYLIRSLIVDLGGWNVVKASDLKNLRFTIQDMLKKGYRAKFVKDEQMGVSIAPKQLTKTEYLKIKGKETLLVKHKEKDFQDIGEILKNARSKIRGNHVSKNSYQEVLQVSTENS